MSGITATVTSQPITATASGGGITASVGSSTITASAGGGIGPQGPSGTAGAPGTAGAGLGDLTDAVLVGTADGDLLRYSSGKWRNHPEANVIIDGANF